MEYGCIGEHLSHSFSKEIHAAIGEYSYILQEIEPRKLEEFIKNKNFSGINVTIPYKSEVIPYLNGISPQAKDIGAVNTIVNKDGVLYGYNTDFFGMRALIQKTGLELSGKKVLIAGTGGTSKTAFAVARSMGASDIVVVGRTGARGSVTYEDVYRHHTDAQIIINTTPCGMYPDIANSPLDTDCFSGLQGAIDAVYNPLRTVFVQQVQKRGLPAQGGLYMLVAQAVFAAEKFTGKSYGTRVIDEIYGKILSEKENIVLIGMPGSGKTTVGKILADNRGLEFVDTDKYIEQKYAKSPEHIIRENGIDVFRDIESAAVEEICVKNGCIIATGGGAVLREKNVDLLKQNGRLWFLDRPIEDIVPTQDRPLSSNTDELKKRYHERYDIYCSVADEVIKADRDACKIADIIGGKLI